MKHKNEYLARTEGNQEIQYWITHNLENYLKNNPETVSDIEHIIDFFLSSDAPKRLMKMSYPDALRLSDQWVERMNKKSQGIVELETDTKTVIQFKNGFRLAQLVGEAAFKREGLLMSHCVGSYFNKGSSSVYSLRDNNNNPHCTIEVSEGSGGVQQIKGKGNGPIHPKYVGGVLASLKKISKEDIRDCEMENLGYITVDGPTKLIIRKGYVKPKFVTFNGSEYFYIYS